MSSLLFLKQNLAKSPLVDAFLAGTPKDNYDSGSAVINQVILSIFLIDLNW